jgi:2-iminobutanoate/2-iminopropanoate deaminase
MKQQVKGTEPSGAYSPGIIAEGRFLYVSGQGPERDGAPILSTIEDETRLTLENVGRVLEAAGASFADVVRCGVFITEPEYFGPMNEVYREFFPEPLPTRTTVVAGLVGGIKIEIDCVAVMPS